MANGANGLPAVFKTQLDDTWSTAKDGEPVGTIRKDGNKTYMVIQYDDSAVAAAANKAVYYTSGEMENYKASSDVSDSYGSSGAKAVAAGVLQAAIADQSYGWIQVGGIATITTDAAAGAAGDAVTGVGANDGGLDVSAAVTDAVSGILLDTTTTAQVYYLDCPFNH